MEKISEKIEKVVVHSGLGKMSQQAQFKDKLLPEVLRELATITGQKPAVRQAKKSIAGFKTRVGDIIGAQTTLRGEKMDHFLIRLLNFAIPRVKDFRGIDEKNVDHSGNLNIGLKEQYVFPETNMETSKVTFGIQVTIVPKTKNREQAVDLYRSIGVPFKHKK